MSQQHHGAPREARNVASSAGTGQALHFFVAMAPSGVEIAETIHFGGAEKADVHAALLQQAHHVEHRAALRGTAQIRRIAHGVEQFGGRSFAEHAIFKKAHRTRRVRAARDEEGEHRQAHADEYEFAISDFTRGSGYHQFTEGVATRREIGFGASHYDCALSFFRMSQAQREYCAINFLRMAAQPPETVCGALWNLHWCGRAERAAENRQPVSQSRRLCRHQCPWKLGLRFSKNAFRPSRQSCDSKQCRCRRISSSSAASRSLRCSLLMRCFTSRCASPAPVAMLSASFLVSASN